jgi:hypothetical protein
MGEDPARRSRSRDEIEEILTAADARDAAAESRDAAAVERENALDKSEFLDPEGGYGEHWEERREAGMDRARSKDDRAASHDDRVALAEMAEEAATEDGEDP